MHNPLNYSSLWRFFIILSLLLGTGCSPLKPTVLQPEYAAPPANNVIWDAVTTKSDGNWYSLLDYGPDALDWRLRAIDSASDRIDLQTFLWFFDTTGAMVLNHIVRAADRNVKVRILVDDTFLVHENQLLLALAQHSNIEYRVYNPFKRRSGGLITRQLLNLAEFRRLDHRMHNKAMVIDNRVAIVGGRNIADEYFGLSDSSNFRDLELLMGGPIAQDISTVFDEYWNNPWSFPIEILSHNTASPEQLAEAQRVTDLRQTLHVESTKDELIATWLSVIENAYTGHAILYADKPPKDNPKNREEAPIQVANELITLFNNAKSEILIVSAYLIPTSELEEAVKRAVERGVRVRILTNSIGSNNHLAAHSAYRNHINTLLKDGVEMHEVRTDARDREHYMLTPIKLKKLALHAKAIVIDDDKAFIGSANLDPRSLRINTEMGLLVISEAFNTKLRNALESDFLAANAWCLKLRDNGSVYWVTEGRTLESQPATSFMQSIEDWFFSLLPIESEL